MHNLYSNLLSSSPSGFFEKNQVYLPIKEIHLQLLWFIQRFQCPLKTNQGESIEVISPGIWNRESGPDFLKAHLRIESRDYRGDVEIHLNEEGWYEHRHHQNPLYNQVILHLSLFPSKHQLAIFKENGQEPFVGYFLKDLDYSFQTIISNFKSRQTSHHASISRGKCGDLLFPFLSHKEIQILMQSASYWRLEKKLNQLEQLALDRFWQFACGIAMSLGYKHNSRSFLELFLYLIPYRDLPSEELFAIALGCCGFLEENYRSEWEQTQYYLDLRKLWWRHIPNINHQVVLKLDHIRPLHHPIRRLVYLVRLMKDKNFESLWSSACRIWFDSVKNHDFNPKDVRQNLLMVFPCYQDHYWDYHYNFESQNLLKPLPILGNDVKMNIVINAFLPLLYGVIREKGGEKDWENFQKFYASLKLPKNSKDRYLYQRFFEGTLEKKFLNFTQMSQGAYQIHQDFCKHFETSCDKCPFVERYWSSKFANE